MSAFRCYCGAVNGNRAVGFRVPIARTIASLIELLEQRDEDIRWKTAELIGELANHCEQQLDRIAAQLIR